MNATVCCIYTHMNLDSYIGKKRAHRFSRDVCKERGIFFYGCDVYAGALWRWTDEEKG